MSDPKSNARKTKRIFYPNPITGKTTKLEIDTSIIKNSHKFPVAVTTMYEKIPLTIYIDINYSVRGVEQSIFLDKPDTRIDGKASQELLKEKVGCESFGNVLLLGLGKAGKTSILKRLSQHYFDKRIQPTLGTNIMKAVLENTSFLFYDVGGQKGLRSKWTTTVRSPDAIVYVLDVTSNPEQLEESKTEFDKVINHYYPNQGKVSNIPLLILGNKIDVFSKQNIHKDSLMRAVFNVVEPDRFKNINYHLGLVSALTGEGIVYNFKWLISEKINLSA